MSAKQCVFCLANGHIRREQVLGRGDHMYVCAPRGQLVEGCLILATYDCVGCLARAPLEHFAELDDMLRIIERFYADTYRVENGTFYEQGRAGGGAVTDPDGGFPHHAHLFCLPLALDLHQVLASEHARLDDTALTAVRSPYVYIDGLDRGSGRRRQAIYVARTQEGRAELERLRLKTTVARLVGLPDRGEWRAHPGDDEVARVVERFTSHRTTEGVGHV